ncbi:MAG: SRPBCC family protein [Actinomycetota bacterium]|nr:SRPBCC family protein [Actinomycetota bacterium]
MEIKDSFRVSTPIEDTWKVLLDIERIAPLLPGAELQEIEGDEYRGAVKVKVGPITAQYKGTAKLVEVDDANHRFVIDASGRDTRGQGNAKASIVVDMREDNGGTVVDVATDLSITGKVAQFGRGVLADVSGKLMKQFVENLERDVLSSEAPAPAKVDAPVEMATGPRQIDSAPAEPVDLFGVAGAPVTKRLIPVGIGVLVLFIAWRLLRRKK